MFCLPARQLKTLILLTSGNRLSFDFSVFHIVAGTTGWPPHRDRGGESTGAFRRDQMPQYVTSWIALSDATCTNSCLHVVPKAHDPGYVGGDPPDLPPFLGVLAAGGEAALQRIRALPCTAGSLVQFSHRLLHWGSAAEDGPAAAWRAVPERPRIALSFASVDDAFERPFLSRDVLPLPPVATRIALVGALALLYTQNDPPTPFRRNLFWDLVQSESAALDARFLATLSRSLELEDAGAAQADGLHGSVSSATREGTGSGPRTVTTSGPAPFGAGDSSRAHDDADTDGSYLMFPPGPKLEAKLDALARKLADGVLTAEQYEKATRDVRVARLVDPAFAPLRREEAR